MTDLSDLVSTTLPSSVRIDEGAGGLPRISIESPRGVAEVYFQGAHVTAWHPAADERPVLWLSRKSAFEPGKPIRGGVPICFPWFGPHPVDASAPAHGFARLREWRLVDAQEDAAGAVTLAMELAGEGMSPQWPYSFRAIHRISVGSVLRMDLEVHNEGPEDFTFEEALHTYFGVRDIRNVALTGLEGCEYLDKVAGGSRSRESVEPVRFAGDTDRVYLNTRAPCVIHDPGERRQIAVSKTGSDATVIWNPWIDKARRMPDFGDDEWPAMLCVETCNVNAHARTLPPGGSHTMTAIITTQELRD
jgi:glucose-6-phosphate 1-epimerase